MLGVKLLGTALRVHLRASVAFVSCRSSMNAAVSETTVVGVIASGVLFRPPASEFTATYPRSDEVSTVKGFISIGCDDAASLWVWAEESCDWALAEPAMPSARTTKGAQRLIAFACILI